MTDDQAKIEAFLAERGVTVCPPTGSPELREYHERQDAARLARTGNRRWGQWRRDRGS